MRSCIIIERVVLLGQSHVEAEQHDEVLEKQVPVVRLEDKAMVDDLNVTCVS